MGQQRISCLCWTHRTHLLGDHGHSARPRSRSRCLHIELQQKAAFCVLRQKSWATSNFNMTPNVTQVACSRLLLAADSWCKKCVDTGVSDAAKRRCKTQMQNAALYEAVFSVRLSEDWKRRKGGGGVHTPLGSVTTTRDVKRTKEADWKVKKPKCIYFDPFTRKHFQSGSWDKYEGDPRSPVHR